MTAAVEVRSTQVALIGRVADELTRDDLGPSWYDASLRNHRRQSIRKPDGYFVFTDLPPSPPDYDVELSGPQYQSRRVTATATAGAVELDTTGEDELHVIVTARTGSRVAFNNIAFVPRIRAGSQVVGPGGFTTTLDEPIEGADVDGADLGSAAGLAVGQPLRIIRSRRLLLRPGPYYAFPRDTTIVAVRVVDLVDRVPIPEAQVEITECNTVAVTSAMIAGVRLHRANLSSGASSHVMLGTDAARQAFTTARGDAVFYYPPATPLTSLTIRITKLGYTTMTQAATVTAGTRTPTVVELQRS